MTCDHSSLGRDPSKVIFFDCCHSYFAGDRRLASVTSVIKEVWPVKPSWDGVDMAIIENARERGIETDALFSAYIAGTLVKIPAGTRHDAKDRFFALKEWWDKGPMAGGKSQMILADDEIAGTADLVVVEDDVGIWDVKNTAAIESTYSLQIAAYCELYEAQYKARPRRGGVIHVTQPKDKPVIVRQVEYDLAVARSEWRIVRDFWTLAQRKSKRRST